MTLHFRRKLALGDKDLDPVFKPPLCYESKPVKRGKKSIVGLLRAFSELKKFSPWQSSVAMPSVNTPEHTRSFVVQEVAWFNRSRDWFMW